MRHARRATARWMEGAPKNLLSCHYTPEQADPWTIFVRTEDPERILGVHMSEHPAHPQGIGTSSEWHPYERARFLRSAPRSRKCRFLDLPPDCQALARRLCEEEEEPAG